MTKLCIKCGVEGHTNKSCKQPVTSFGLVVFTKGKPGLNKGRIYPHQHAPCIYHDNLEKDRKRFEQSASVSGEILFLLVERKDTVGFLNLVQGSYPDLEPYKSRKINRYIYELTCEERNKIVNWSFKDLWSIAGSEKKDISKAQSKFEKLDIKRLLSKNECQHREADFLMPKGRLKFSETTRQCAVREFSEETGYSKDDVRLLKAPPYIEQFTGTDGKTYRNVFFISQLKDNAKIYTKLGEDPSQSKEVRNIGWFNLQECQLLIRDYHQEKKDILSSAHTFISNMIFNQMRFTSSIRDSPQNIKSEKQTNFGTDKSSSSTYDNSRESSPPVRVNMRKYERPKQKYSLAFRNRSSIQYKQNQDVIYRRWYNWSSYHSNPFFTSYSSPQRGNSNWRPDTYGLMTNVASVQMS